MMKLRIVWGQSSCSSHPPLRMLCDCLSHQHKSRVSLTNTKHETLRLPMQLIAGILALSVFPKGKTVHYAHCGHRTSNFTITFWAL